MMYDSDILVLKKNSKLQSSCSSYDFIKYVPLGSKLSKSKYLIVSDQNIVLVDRHCQTTYRITGIFE